MPARRLASLSALVLVPAAVLAGCGDGDTTTVTETAPAETTTGTEETTANEATATATEPTTGNAGPARFQTPSGNIGCALSAQGVRCDIAERDWQPKPPKQPCELDYGQGISLDASGAAFVCAGDTTLGAGATLPYGETSSRGRFSCDSSQAGVGCTDSETGAGFFLSREEYDLRGSSS